MIILNKNPGRLCNSLWAILPFITLHLNSDETVLIKHFSAYYDLFENLSLFANIQFDPIPFTKTHCLYNKALSISSKFLPPFVLNRFDLCTDKYYWETLPQRSSKKKSRILFVSVDYPKATIANTRFHQQLQDLFRPKRHYIEKVKGVIYKQKSKADLLIGVHIRRGDYTVFKAGTYWFDDPTYCHYMTELEELFRASGQKVAFLLCSDEPVQLRNYKPINCFCIEEAEAIEDLYALSLCDYIIGPPSTFSMWASFYGQVPLRILKSSEEKVTLDQFSTIISQDRFENGETFTH